MDADNASAFSLAEANSSFTVKEILALPLAEYKALLKYEVEKAEKIKRQSQTNQ